MATILIDAEAHQVTNDEVAKILTSLRDEVKVSKILIEEYKAALRMADLEHNVTKAAYSVEVEYRRLLQSSSFWGRIVRVFKGY